MSQSRGLKRSHHGPNQGNNAYGNNKKLNPDSNLIDKYAQHRERAVGNASQPLNQTLANPNGLANQNMVPQTNPNSVPQTNNTLAHQASPRQLLNIPQSSNAMVLVTLTLDKGYMYDIPAEDILLGAFRKNKLEGSYTDARCITDSKDKPPASSTRTRSSSFAWKSSRMEAGRFS
jgi:hypothetical protein